MGFDPSCPWSATGLRADMGAGCASFRTGRESGASARKPRLSREILSSPALRSRGLGTYTADHVTNAIGSRRDWKALEVVHLLPSFGDPYSCRIGLYSHGTRDYTQREGSGAASHMRENLPLGPRRTRHLRKPFGGVALDRGPRALSPGV